MRIAIYVRKSKWTGRGESIENQIHMCREYIEKFIEDSGEAQILVYSDEGFSGKDTNRPEFQKMLEDMKQGPFQYLVCYRLDRLGRNLADLALLIEKLNREHTEFVSIKEHFDTSTPMGKAMVYPECWPRWRESRSGSGSVTICFSWPEAADGWEAALLWDFMSGKSSMERKRSGKPFIWKWKKKKQKSSA